MNQFWKRPVKGKKPTFTLITTRYVKKNVWRSPEYNCDTRTEGITIIGDYSFLGCSSLKEIKFPNSLTSIGVQSFADCLSLEEVDLLHTNVQELGNYAFALCTSLREMKVPDSPQNFGVNGSGVFFNCPKLVPSHVNDIDNKAVVTYLRSIQYSPHLPPLKKEKEKRSL